MCNWTVRYLVTLFKGMMGWWLLSSREARIELWVNGAAVGNRKEREFWVGWSLGFRPGAESSWAVHMHIICVLAIVVVAIVAHSSPPSLIVPWVCSAHRVDHSRFLPPDFLLSLKAALSLESCLGLIQPSNHRVHALTHSIVLYSRLRDELSKKKRRDGPSHNHTCDSDRPCRRHHSTTRP